MPSIIVLERINDGPSYLGGHFLSLPVPEISVGALSGSSYLVSS